VTLLQQEDGADILTSASAFNKIFSGMNKKRIEFRQDPADPDTRN
jgi:hypothetical protein